MKEVTIESESDGRKWFSECNRWFDLKEEDGKIERELLAIEQPNTLKKIVNDQTSINSSRNRYDDDNFETKSFSKKFDRLFGSDKQSNFNPEKIFFEILQKFKIKNY